MEQSRADIRGAPVPEGPVPEWAVRYDAREYPRQAVTGDAVALALDGGRSLQALVVERGGEPFAGMDAFPGGFMDWAGDRDSEQAAVRELREETGLAAPGYVEALGSYSRNGRDPRQFAGHRDPATGEWVSRGSRVTTCAYLMLVGKEGRAAPFQAGEDAADARWTDLYAYFPWEDLRTAPGRAAARATLAALERWAAERGGDRAERVAFAFGFGLREWNEERVPERFALLLEAGRVPEARRDLWGRADPLPDDARLGRPMAFDHRVILADALGRLRGKIKYLPAALMALAGDRFTLDELQAACEAIAGRPLHRANFRRAVAESRGSRRTRTPRIVAGTGRRRPRGPGEPGVDPELYRFRPDAVRARLETSLRLPWLAADTRGGAGEEG
ncbi:MAG TPA: NUDIX domain-containing protein [Longimicrobiaceae bacterium]|nr:NUDIX domain-containing protein [Longimicrobiaceae bacterium]